MNINPILAVLVLKKILTREEGEKVAEFVHDKPQSTILGDVITQIREVLDMSQQPLTGGPQQQAEELAARERDAEERRKADEAAKALESENEESAAADGAEEDAKKEAEPSDAKSSKK